MINTLYYGDNLEILRDRDYFPNECVDLIRSTATAAITFCSKTKAESRARPRSRHLTIPGIDLVIEHQQRLLDKLTDQAKNKLTQ